MSEMKWSTENTAKLISAYKEQPNLWNPDHEHHRNKLKRIESFKEMAAQFGVTFYEIERKIKNMKSQYQRERRVSLKHDKEGVAFRPKWFGYAAMSFLQDRCRTRQRKVAERFDECDESTVSVKLEESLEEDDLEDLLKDPEEPDVKIEPSEYKDNVQYCPILHVNVPAPAPTFEGPISPAKEPEPSTSSGASGGSLVGEAFHVMKCIYERQDAERKKRDECDVFGELMARGMRKLKTEYSRSTVQNKICNLLYEAQTGKYDTPGKSARP